MTQAYFFCAVGTLAVGIIVLMVGLLAIPTFEEGTCTIAKTGDALPQFVCERRCSWFGFKCEDYARFDGVSNWLQSGTRPACSGFYGASGGCQSTGSKLATSTAVSCLMGDDQACYVDEAGIPTQEAQLKSFLIWIGAALAVAGLCSAIAAFATSGFLGPQALGNTRVLNTGHGGYKRAPLRIDNTHAAPLEHDDSAAWNPWLACARACARQPPPGERPVGYDRPTHPPQSQSVLGSLMNFGGGGHAAPHSARGYGGDPRASMQMAGHHGGDPRASMQMASRGHGGYH